MRISKPSSNYHIINFDLIESCGVNAALILPIIEKAAGWAHCEGTAIRELGQIRFRCSYDDVKTLVPFMSSDEYLEALNALADMRYLIVSEECIVMADMYGMDPPKVTIKDEAARQHRYIYVFKDGSGLVKIGITIDLKRRSKELYPAEHVISAKIAEAARMERELHDRYAAYRKGGEWFRLPDEKLSELVAEIGKLAR